MVISQEDNVKMRRLRNKTGNEKGDWMSGLNNKEYLNRTFTRSDLRRYVDVSPTVNRLRNLVRSLTCSGLLTTSTGLLDSTNLNETIPFQFTLHSMRAWEYGRVFDVISSFGARRVLDCGGASSPLVFLLGKEGYSVTTLDLQLSLERNTRAVAEQMDWPIDAVTGNMTQMPFASGTFDAVVSISVIEHMSDKLKAQAMIEISRVVRPGGLVAITFDFGETTGTIAGYEYAHHDQTHTPLRSCDDIRRLLIEPSGMIVLGNQMPFSAKVDPDREFIRQVWIKNSIRGKSLCKDLVRLLYSYSPFFNSPYFHYTAFSLFLQKRISLPKHVDVLMETDSQSGVSIIG
jgi:2-polyprenyl-3-methyl-5-hydroxy-6-metoxy-1,4-benzoquinol methylase